MIASQKNYVCLNHNVPDSILMRNFFINSIKLFYNLSFRICISFLWNSLYNSAVDVVRLVSKSCHSVKNSLCFSSLKTWSREWAIQNI